MKRNKRTQKKSSSTEERERERETLDFPFFQSDDDDDKSSRDVITNVSSFEQRKSNLCDLG